MAANKARLTLAKNLKSLTAKQDAFMKAVECMQSFKEDTLNDLILEIEAKQSELDELDKTYSIKFRDGKIETDQKIKEYSYNTALEIIKNNNQIVVDEEEYNTIKQDNEVFKSKLEEEIQKIKDEEKTKHKKELSACLSNMELKHKAETAVLTATGEQKEREVEHLTNTIASMKIEIDAQRQLTKEVAVAGRQGAIQQSFGKAN